MTTLTPLRAAWRGTMLLCLPTAAGAASLRPGVGGVPLDFFFLAAVLLGVLLWHRHALTLALGGALLITLYQLGVTGFPSGAGLLGLADHWRHEQVMLANLLGLLLGFALLADHFEQSRLPAVLGRRLPGGWQGGFMLLAGVFVISSFLDNIAAAMIGGTMASALFRRRVHVGYLAAIAAAANAGGAGSVLGDTTTTMLWIAGASPLGLLKASLGGVVALGFFGVIAARQQQRYQPLQRGDAQGAGVDAGRLAVVALVLLAALATNPGLHLLPAELQQRYPVIGAAVVLTLLITAPLRLPDWRRLPGAFKGGTFLLALVWCASLMPVEALPAPSWQLALGLGFVSALFDNIPLTALAIRQDGFDWGFVAYAAGFGGSMIWFGSSAGVALCSLFPEGRSAAGWLRAGWHVALAYLLGFAVMLVLTGWQGQPMRPPPAAPAAQPSGG